MGKSEAGIHSIQNHGKFPCSCKIEPSYSVHYHDRQDSVRVWSRESVIETLLWEGTIIQKESCTKMFIAALFTIARTWKQPKCPSSDEWIKRMWHIYTMEYFSAIKRNEIELFVVRWMELESVIQSEVSQKEKNKYSMLTHIYGI